MAALPAMPSLLVNLRKSGAGRSGCQEGTGPLEREPRKLCSLPEDDALEGRLAELMDFDALLALIEAAGKAFLQATAKLDPVLEHLASRRRAADGCEGHEEALRLAAELDSWCSRLKGASTNLEGLQQQVQQSRFQSARAREALAAREAARAIRQRCEDQVAVLYQKNTKKTYTLQDKKARLAAKDCAIEAFDLSTDRATRSVDVVLARRPQGTAAMLGRLCGFLRQASEPGSPAARGPWSSGAPRRPQPADSPFDVASWFPQAALCGMGRAACAPAAGECAEVRCGDVRPFAFVYSDAEEDQALQWLAEEVERRLREVQRLVGSQCGEEDMEQEMSDRSWRV